MRRRVRRAAGSGRRMLVLLAGLALAAPAAAQQIVLDKPVTAAGLTLFPQVKQEDIYYYVPSTPHLATDSNGRPQFSFLRYVQNVSGAEGEDAPREGEGGGIVHAVVALDVSDDQLKEAQRELRRINPAGVIQGPVIFKSGKFGLVSSFANTEGDLTTQVVGLGNAPVLEGSKAAVSIQLTKLGAKVLWESFQTPTPDISFSFEMDLEGFLSPKQARIEANFDQIYEHTGFSAGIATPYLSGEIKAAFDDLQKQGAIKVESIGGDEQLDALIGTAYTKLTEMMFAPMGGGGASGALGELGNLGGGSQQSALDKASNQLNQGRQAAAAGCREGGTTASGTTGATASPSGSVSGSVGGATRTRDGEVAPDTSADPPPVEDTPPPVEDTPPPPTEDTPPPPTEDAAPPPVEDTAPPPTAETPPPTGDTTGDAPAGTDPPASDSAGISPVAETDDARRDRERRARQQEYQDCLDKNQPSIAIVASFEMKKIRQRGKFEIDLNKWTADTMTLRFDENIGDLRKLMKNQDHFRSANLDDPLFRQREIVAFVDGVNATDFGEFINFVTVNLKKKHESGDETYEEVRIDRENFNREGNSFRMIYGWKGDENRARWLDYQWQAHWSFFGGHEIVQDWRNSIAGAINLAPPYQRRSVTLDADPDEIKDLNVRAITVRVFYKLGSEERIQQVTLNASRGELSNKIEYIQPAGDQQYEYEISWKLRGNKTVSTGRRSGTDAILFVDELPEASAEAGAAAAS